MCPTPELFGVQLVETIERVTPQLLRGFFVGWPKPPSPESLLAILSGSSHVVLAVDNSGGNVVGFITAVSDGHLAAYIPLLEVLPAFQGRGIGSALVRRMLHRLDAMYMVDVVCDPDVAPFYERLGLQRMNAMVRRNYAALGGRPHPRDGDD